MKKVILNGEEKNFDVETISDIVSLFKLDKKRIAVEVNGRIVKKENFDKIKVNDNDKIEIVHFVGGG